MDPHTARAALDDVGRERMRVVDHAIPGWIAPVLAVAFAAYFAVQDLAGPAVRHVMVFVFSLGYLALVLGPLLRRRGEHARLRADLVPPEHRRRVRVAAMVLLVLLLGGVLVGDLVPLRQSAAVYGLTLGLLVITGGWWLRHALQRQVRTTS